MPSKTKIEWADYISNPIKARYEAGPYPMNGGHSVLKQGHACVKISEGCAHCWASTFNVRLGTGLEYTVPNMERVEMFLDEAELDRIRKFKPRGPFKNGRDRALVFPFDMTDVFGDWVPNDWIERCLAIFASRQDVDFLILTKRPDLMKRFLFNVEPLPNVILGTSVENQRRANERWVPMVFLSRKGWRTCVSYEPALEAVGWYEWEFLNLLICGGESGHGARVMYPRNARSARDFCAKNEIPFFFKQWGEYAPLSNMDWITDKTTFRYKPVQVAGETMVRVGKALAGHVLDGREWREMPKGKDEG